MTLPANFHRWLVLALLMGNAVAFAGVDPVTRLVTALATLVLVIDLRKAPVVPKPFPALGLGLAGLVALQLIPLPALIRRLVQPGLADVIAPGFATLSLAPWATIQSAAGLIVVIGLALTASRMASTRSGLPALLGILAVTGALIAVLGLVGEASGPGEVLVRQVTVGGTPYGAYVNKNHFAQGLELTLPAVLVLAVAALRNVFEPGPARQRALAMSVVCVVALGLGGTAMLRSNSRGGIMISVLAALATLPWWRRAGRRRPWPVVALTVALTLGAAGVVASRVPTLRDSFKQLFVVEGIEGNTRWDLWRGAAELALRTPVVGTGIGTYRHAAGLDKPATGEDQLEQAHNDWIEWTAESGIVGLALLLAGVAALGRLLWPGTTRQLRFEYRYAAAGGALAGLATMLHEGIGFGLQTPLNAYLAAIWVGIAWSLADRRTPPRRPTRSSAEPGDVEPEEVVAG